MSGTSPALPLSPVTGSTEVLTWRPEQGLPHVAVERLLVGHDGWLWIGTREGLARFDGVKFTTFNHRSPGFTSDAILDLAAGPAGDLWIATKRGLYHKRGGDFTRYTVEDGLGDDHVADLCVGPDGVLWLATGGGLTWLEHGRFHIVPHASTSVGPNHTRETHRYVSCVLADRAGNVWVGSPSGLHRLNRERGELEPVWRDHTPPEATGLGEVRTMAEDRHGGVWWATDLSLVRKRGPAIESFPFPGSTGDVRARRILEDGEGRLWVVRAGEVFRLEHDRLSRAPETASIGHLFVADLAADSFGNLWAGTRHGGLHRLRTPPVRTLTTRDGLVHNTVFCVTPANRGGVWVGTARGLQRYREGTFEIPQARPPYVWRPDLSRFALETVSARLVFEDSTGALWASAAFPGGDGIIWLEPVPDGYSLPPIAGMGFPSVVREDRQGRVWVGSRGGLSCLDTNQLWLANSISDPTLRLRTRADRWHFTAGDVVMDRGVEFWTRAGGAWKLVRQGDDRVDVPAVPSKREDWGDPPFPIDASLSNYDVRAIIEDARGALWFGTWGGGVNVLEGGRVQVLSIAHGLVADHVQWMSEDGAGRVWIGTPAGLSRVVRIRAPGETRATSNSPPSASFHIASLTARHGLPDDSVRNLLEDGMGGYWIGTRRGLLRVAVEELNAAADGRLDRVRGLLLDESEGLLTSDIQGGAHSACRSSDGALWFATTLGLACVDPAAVRREERPPAVFVEGLRAGEHEISLLDPTGDAGSRFGMAVASPGLLLPPGSGHSIEIRFTALDYRAPEKVRFRCRLDGHDPAPVEVRDRRVAYYTNLRPGTYRFQVTASASSGQGVWHDPGASLAFAIRPFYYQTAWFHGLCGLAAVAAGALVYRRRVRVLRERQRAQVTEAMHDALAGKLSAIAKAADADACGPGAGIAALARAALRSLRQASALHDPALDTLEGLAAQLIQLVEETFRPLGIAFRLEVPVDLPAQRISPRVREQVFLIVSEAVNNVVKHARAKRVQLRVEILPNQVCFEVEDDGCGFVPDTGWREDRGLSHLRARAATIRGELRIRSSPGRGSSVRLTLRR